MKTILIALVLGLVSVDLTLGVRKVIKTRVRALEVLVGLRPRHVLLALPTIALVITVAVLLAQIPGLNWGWWRALGGTGNVIIGINSDPRLAIVPVLCLSALVVAMPALVEGEERAWRLRAESWSTSRRVWRAIQFGLLHLTVGIPIAAALAISIMGGYYTWTYLRAFRRSMHDYQAGDDAATDPVVDFTRYMTATDHAREAGLLESTRAHLAYNYVGLMTAAALIWGR